MSRSDRKEQAIYDAVHETVMKLRVAVMHRTLPPLDLDAKLLMTQHAAGMAAIAAYRKPLTRKARHEP